MTRLASGSREKSHRSILDRLGGQVRRFLADETGPAAVEYAVMLAMILVACISIVKTLVTSVSSTSNTVNTTLSS